MRCVTRRRKRSVSISRKILVAAFFIGSCLLCTVPVNAMKTTPFLVAFPIVVSTGYVVSIFFAWRLCKSLKKKEKIAQKDLSPSGERIARLFLLRT